MGGDCTSKPELKSCNTPLFRCFFLDLSDNLLAALDQNLQLRLKNDDLLLTNMASVVAVIPRIEQRKHLEAFLHQLPRLGQVDTTNTLDDGRLLIQRSSVPDYVFLADDLNKLEREKFISWTKSKKLGKKTVFITICSANKADTESVAEHLAAGAHGILKEPINLQALQDVIVVAKGVKLQGTQFRLKTAAGLYLSSAIDKLASESGIRIEPKDLRTKVSEAIQDFKLLTGMSLTLEAVHPSDNGEGSGARLERYKGVSRRIKEICERRFAGLITKIFDKPKI